MKVLIIDDDKLVAMSLRTIIEQEEDIDVVDTGFSGEESITMRRSFISQHLTIMNI